MASLPDMYRTGSRDPYGKGESTGVRMGPKWVKAKALELGLYVHGKRQRFGFNLERCATWFKAEVCGIKACADENMKRGYCNGNVYILWDRQAAIKALDSCKIHCKLLWDCRLCLMTLAKCSTVLLMWKSGRKGIKNNGIAGHVAKMGFLRHLWESSRAVCKGLGC
jgi:hypothetical protein